MPDPTPPLDIDAIEDLWRAFPNPWKADGQHVYAPGPDGINVCSVGEPRASTLVGYTSLRWSSERIPESYALAAMIASAPETVLALVAEVRRLRAVEQERDALRTALAEVDVLLEGAGLGSRYRALQIIHAALEAAGDPARGAGEPDA